MKKYNSTYQLILQRQHHKMVFKKFNMCQIMILDHGTPTKRQVSKRLVSKRLKRQVYKTSGCKMSGFKMSTLVNITKCPISKKYIDLTYVMLGEVEPIAYGPHIMLG
jgi:hypothetical protein